jgi:hypothetical protein
MPRMVKGCHDMGKGEQSMSEKQPLQTATSTAPYPSTQSICASSHAVNAIKSLLMQRQLYPMIVQFPEDWFSHLKTILCCGITTLQ